MPGTPDPVLGSDALTLAVACAVGALAASVPYAFRDRLAAPSRVALGGGLASAGLCLGAWAGARFATDAFVASIFESPERLVVFLLWSAVVLGAQAAVPLYLYARWRLLSPLAGLFAVTTLVLYAFLRVGGETDSLALYALFFGPMLIGTIAAVSLAEAGVRRGIRVLVARERG